MRIDIDVPVPMRDGAIMRANVFRPTDDHSTPVIINMGPYGKDVLLRDLYPTMWVDMVRRAPDILHETSGEHIVWETPDPERWTAMGYAVVHVDSRGTGASPGLFDPFSPECQRDFYDAVEWAASQRWSTGKVGILGVSYYAMVAWQVAALRPPHLAAIIPWNGCADLYRDWAYHGGILSNFCEYWWNRWLINQHGHPFGRRATHGGRRTTGPEAFDDATRASLRVDHDVAVLEHPLEDDWWRERNVDWSLVQVPFLSVATWGTWGLHLRGNIEAFRHGASEEKWLMLIPGRIGATEEFHGHFGLELQRQFFDYYLKGIDTRWVQRPRVSVSVRLPGGDQEILTADKWPLPSTKWVPLYLDGPERALLPEPPSSESAFGYPALSQGITLVSRPFAETATVAGPVALKLWVSTDTEDMDMFACLRALDPDGALINFDGPGAVPAGTTPGMPLTRGWLRLSHRGLDRMRSTDEQPYHHHQERLDVAPGAVYEIDVEVWPTSFRIPAGGRLALTLQGQDDLDVNLIAHHHPDDRPWSWTRATNTLHTGAAYPSRLLLPVIAGRP